MTAANNGEGKPEEDDPFGYLYEDGQAAGAAPPSGRGRGYGYPGSATQPGVPRTSYNHVRTVGERQYGQQPPPQQGYHQPNARYAAPETYPGGAPAQQPHPQQPPQGGGRGPNTKGLLVGALAVVAVVLIAIGVALWNNDDDKKSTAGGEKNPQTGSSSAPQNPGEQPESEPPAPKPEENDLPEQDAATLKLGAPAELARDVEGAKGADGAYVKFNGVGGSASWSVDVPESGPYTLAITYAASAKDAKTSLTINGSEPREIRMKNWGRAAEGEWKWTNTFSFVELKKGKNELMISCNPGDECDALLDQVFLKKGHVR
ncbi:carbohydrate-binding protein [Streptomyces sp. NPDC057638]|uniref:carbohydrate-binding protein n=1 Tax=Streptomyces sp. NPDC057638 TaxID=3346190 RepID=UPI0036B09140